LLKKKKKKEKKKRKKKRKKKKFFAQRFQLCTKRAGLIASLFKKNESAEEKLPFSHTRASVIGGGWWEGV